MVLGEKAGLAPQQIYDTLCDSAAASRIFELRGPNMIAGRYDEPTVRVDLLIKDLRLIRRARTWLAQHGGGPSGRQRAGGATIRRVISRCEILWSDRTRYFTG